MTSEKLKSTSGPWTYLAGTSTCEKVLGADGKVVADGWWCRDVAEVDANSRLIAEAGTVFHECGLSPRELLDKNQDYKAQNARLTVALRNLCKHFPTDADMAELGWEVEYVETACQAYDTARAVLATQKE